VLAIHNVPLMVDGVYWRNGLEECMALEFGIPMGKVRVNQTVGENPKPAAAVIP